MRKRIVLLEKYLTGGGSRFSGRYSNLSRMKCVAGMVWNGSNPGRRRRFPYHWKIWGNEEGLFGNLHKREMREVLGALVLKTFFVPCLHKHLVTEKWIFNATFCIRIRRSSPRPGREVAVLHSKRKHVRSNSSYSKHSTGSKFCPSDGHRVHQYYAYCTRGDNKVRSPMLQLRRITR